MRTFGVCLALSILFHALVLPWMAGLLFEHKTRALLADPPGKVKVSYREVKPTPQPLRPPPPPPRPFFPRPRPPPPPPVVRQPPPTKPVEMPHLPAAPAIPLHREDHAHHVVPPPTSSPSPP